MPQELRDRLRQVRGRLESNNWAEEEGFKESHKTWKKEVYDYTYDLVRKNPELQEARTLYRQTEGRIKRE